MKFVRPQSKILSLLLPLWLGALGGCATQEIVAPTLPPEPPGYAKVPHPSGLDSGDLIAMFAEKGSPALDSIKGCESDYFQLRTKTISVDELAQGSREFVKFDPEKYHWCFYGKLMELDQQLQADTYIDERQKHVVETYLFLTPIARAFMEEYHDSRYMRWAVTRYRRLSDPVFYRKLELTPKATEELAIAASPFGMARDRGPASIKQGVLEKYGLLPPSQISSQPLVVEPIQDEDPDLDSPAPSAE